MHRIVSTEKKKEVKKYRRTRQHQNKYANKTNPSDRKVLYNPWDKTFRKLLLAGQPGQVFEAGTRVIYHGRLYILQNGITILPGGHAFGEFVLAHKINPRN